MEIAEHFDIPPGQVGVMLHRLLRYGLIRRISRGIYERVSGRRQGSGRCSLW
jgi:DNA-binding IclR family transcriptional regulator